MCTIGSRDMMQEGPIRTEGVQQVTGRNFTFQQDNDPKHSFRLCKNYLETEVSAGTLCGIDLASSITRAQEQCPTSTADLGEVIQTDGRTDGHTVQTHVMQYS